MASALEMSDHVTEVQVRIDCNGCVQKIKKALHGIKGIADVYIDLPQQKLRIIGSADTDKIIKSLKKARKNAIIISSKSQPQDPPQPPTEPSPDAGSPPPQDAGNPPAEPPKPQPPQPDPPKDEQPPKDHSPENPPPTQEPPPPPPQTKDEEVVHVVHHQAYHQRPEPPGYTGGYAPAYYLGMSYRAEPVHVTHSYNHYRPPPTVTRYEYVQPPPPAPRLSPYADNGRMEDSYCYGNNNGDYNNNGYVTSIFSEENPNACTIS